MVSNNLKNILDTENFCYFVHSSYGGCWYGYGYGYGYDVSCSICESYGYYAYSSSKFFNHTCGLEYGYGYGYYGQYSEKNNGLEVYD